MAAPGVPADTPPALLIEVPHRGEPPASFHGHPPSLHGRDWEGGSNRVSYRSKKSLVVPFYRLPLPAESGQIVIDELVVGPGPHQELCKTAVRTL